MANTNTKYIIKGRIKDSEGNPLGNVKVEAMDSDQNWFEDHNDDLIDSKWVNSDGTFEIPFERKRVQEGWLEGNPDVYLMVRNPLARSSTGPKPEGGLTFPTARTCILR